jgi:hypothetical protein
MGSDYGSDSTPRETVPSPDDAAWDQLAESERRRYLTTLAGEQLAHSTDRVAYFR